MKNSTRTRTTMAGASSVLVILALLLLMAGCAATQAAAQKSTPQSDQSKSPAHEGRLIESVSLDSPALEREVELKIYLPADYLEGDARHPVLYMHDGQNLFTGSPRNRYSSWQAAAAIDAIPAALTPRPIVVGVEHGNAARMAEYSPFRDSQYIDDPRGDAHLEFLLQQVKPYIDNEFRSLPGRAHTWIAGSSMGGLISLYAAFSHPEVFGAVLSFSPALWIGEGALLQWLQENELDRRMLVYIDMGDTEYANPEDDARLLQYLEETAEIFRSAGWEEDQLEIVIGENHNHNESAWAQRLPGALGFVLGEDE